MSKLNKKGFMLAEVVVVAVVVATALVTLYIGLNKVSLAYETRNRYNDIDALYYAMEVNDNIDNVDIISNIYENFGYTIATVKKIDGKGDLVTLKESVSNQTFKDYIDYLTDNIDDDSYIITELCKTEDDCYYYALKVKDGDTNEET